MCVAGLALGVTVHFDSPVIGGSDVEMECRYTYTGSNSFRVRWYKRPQEGTQATICETFFSTSSSSNTCSTGKFTPVNQDSYENGHTIKLLNAGEEDEGEYWCSFQLLARAPSTSPKLQLDVQSEWCSY